MQRLVRIQPGLIKIETILYREIASQHFYELISDSNPASK